MYRFNGHKLGLFLFYCNVPQGQSVGVFSVLNTLFYFIEDTNHKTTLLIHCGNCMVCHKTYNIIKQYTYNASSHSSKLQFTRTNSYLPFIPKHSSILSQPHRPHIPISSRCVLSLSACLLNACPNGRWNE